ncbi:MAG: outer membrane protein assembly factor BamE [Pseudomonadota bacterium]|nr:outer membrane protein assembly factor BamE [Pseudomonadota bacterium]
MVWIKYFERGGSKPRRIIAIASAAAIVVSICACSDRLQSHGNIPNQEIVESIRIGKTTRTQISEMLGTPSARATFDQESWYYVGTRTKKTAFIKEEVLDRKVLVIRFNKQGVVQRVQHLSKRDGREIQIVNRKTPTKGKELTILEQLLGNVGRFGGAPVNE